MEIGERRKIWNGGIGQYKMEKPASRATCALDSRWMVREPPEFGLLSIERALPALRQALIESPSVVLQAPPGAGKTTRVPIALLDAPWLEHSRILMLEPR